MRFSSESTGFLVNRTLNLNGRLADFSTPRVMGILNVTPDSFYDGNSYRTESDALNRAVAMVSEGADIIDVGGYSTRPGASEIAQSEELNRVIPVIRAIRKELPTVIISLDTFRSEVARAGVEAGAEIINDVSGGNLDPAMHETVAALRVPYIVMHMRGTPATMAGLSHYDNVTVEVLSDLREKILRLTNLGISDIIVDPGFGFAKDITQNFELLGRLRAFLRLERPVLVGVSRKSMIWKTLRIEADHALNGTTVLNTVALLNGASVIRVHDVKEAVESIALVKALNTARGSQIYV